jgi:hypothetical protein
VPVIYVIFTLHKPKKSQRLDIMDDELLYSNKFIASSEINAGYGMTEELRKETLRRSFQQPLSDTAVEYKDLLEHDILKFNPVQTDENELKDIAPRKLHKEERVVININSNQRIFFDTTNVELGGEVAYINYFNATEYAVFSELWTLLIGVVQELKTFAEYAENNAIDIEVVTAPVCDRAREMVRGLVLARSLDATESNTVVNDDLMALLINIADVNASSGNLAIINSLNAYAMSASAANPDNFWRPFYYDKREQQAKLISFKSPDPNSYTIALPSIINHVKSIRLLSTEIPNTVNNITQRNNLITLNLRYRAITLGATPENRPVSLDSNKSVFNFILVKLDIGSYTTESLVKHIQDKLNSTVEDLTVRKFQSVFKVSYNSNTGEIKIECLRKELEFHLKFYSELREVQSISETTTGSALGYIHGIITDYSHDLWHILGFPWPYEIAASTKDKYTQLLSNVVSFGYHEIFDPTHSARDDIFDRNIDNVAYQALTSGTNLLTLTGNNIIVQSRPSRYPSIDIRYIYLVLKGYKSIQHVNQQNGVVDFNEHDIFAKIQLNVATGKIAYNTFVSNPLIFPNVIDSIRELDVMWVDERGYPVDFNKVDHSFTLEFIHYITQVDINGYDTKLGDIDKQSYPEYLTGSKG